VSGQWVDQQVLERLSGRAQGPLAPSRCQLVEEFCLATDWHDAKGRLSVSSASVALRRLEQRGLVQLPPMLASLSSLPVGGLLRVAVPRREGRPARTATLELRWSEVELQPPAVALKKSWPPLKVYAVVAREVGAHPGAQDIEWLLLTTWPVKTLKMARRLVRWYALRWGIECWHKVLKVVCGVERRQMKSAQALERALALDMIVASRVLLLTRLGKEHPELPAELFYTAESPKLCDLAGAQGQTAQAENFQRRLELYRFGRAYHNP
jgi:hypothetical protein